jgi:hypothetical protein
MKKFFIVENDSNLGKDYWNYIENGKVLNTYVKKFMEDNNMETSKYFPHIDHFFIIPTENDIKNFSSQLCKENSYSNLRAFKKGSIIDKAWKQLLSDNNLKVLVKPYINSYIDVSHHFEWELFHIGDMIYGSLKSGSPFDLPKGINEINGSEFYKVLERNDMQY